MELSKRDRKEGKERNKRKETKEKRKGKKFGMRIRIVSINSLYLLWVMYVFQRV
jgi:hypothetical protein